MRKGKTALQKYRAVVEGVLDQGLPEAALPRVVTQRLYRPGELLTLPTAAGFMR